MEATAPTTGTPALSAEAVVRRREDDVDKVKAGARRERFLRIERLYRSGLSLAHIGEQIEPPITAQRAGQILRQGAALGLYLLPEMHRDRRRRIERRLTDLEVREALLSTRRVEQAAKRLGITKSAIQTRFGHVLVGVRAERRKRRDRAAVVAAYRALAERLGHEPNTSEMPRPLAARIQRQFGTIRQFYKVIRACPQDRRRRS